jgi:ribosome-associated toxin RatA of RatAB toxin-antitoxin module
MSEIHKSVTIDASAEKVYALVDNPERFSEFVPNVERVVDIKRSEGRVGDSFRVIYKVMGITFDEKFTVTEHQPPRKAGSRFEGGMKGTFDWSFEPQGQQTKTSVVIRYELAGGVLGKAVDALVLERTNAKTIEDMLQNMSRILTRQGAPQS